MKDKLITFETAQLAKEKGFNGLSYFYFMEHQPDKLREAFNKNRPWDFNIENEFKLPSKSITVPTQSLLQKWLREVHNIGIFFMTDTNEQWVCTITRLKKGVGHLGGMYNHNDIRYISYEEALEKGLQEGLKLIS